MNKEQRQSIIAAAANEISNNVTSGTFKYKPPNNTGTKLGIMGGILTIVGDGLATIGAIIQLNSDEEIDFQSQVEDFQSNQEKEQMRQEIDDLKEMVKQLEELVKSNQKT